MSKRDIDLPNGPRVESRRDTHLVAISDDLLGTANVSGYFTSLNPAWERTLGFSRSALMAQPFIEFVHPADRAATIAEAEQVLLGHATGEFENRYAASDGGWRWLSWQTDLHNGEIYFCARDITDEVTAVQRRRLNDHLIEAVDDSVITKTTDGVVTSWNPVAEELFGYSAEEAIGRTMADLVVPEDLQEEPMLIVRRLLDGEGVRQYTTQRHRKDGTPLTVSLTASLMRDDDHNVVGVAVVSRDVSELSLDDLHVRSEIDSLAWVGRVRDAIDEDRIIFHAQPIVSLEGGADSYELLCRMSDRDGGIVPAGLFLPPAERYGLIEELDRLAIREGARQIAAGRRVSVNLSAASVGRRHIGDVICDELRDAKADPSHLTIEITETALMRNMAAAQRFATAVGALGCRLSLDDFGTGFGGFTYLKKLSIDQIKIDVEFVRDLHSSSASQHVVKAVVALAKDFELDTVAEGVENEESAAMLREYGVAYCQGYLFAKPAPMEQVIADRSSGRQEDSVG